MRKTYITSFAVATLAASGLVSCGSEGSKDNSNEGSEAEAEFGIAEVALTNAPGDVRCVMITAEGSARTVSKKFSVLEGENAVFRLNRLPVGSVKFSADAFDAPCGTVVPPIPEPTWLSQDVSVRLRGGILKNVALLMVQNGRAAVSVDFDSSRGLPADPTGADCSGTVSGNPQAYVVPVAPGITTHPVLTVGDSPNLKPDGVTPYRLVGIPDGMGAFDNGDATFTLLVNHELSAGDGVVRAHGATGAFVSKHTICKSNLEVVKSEDLIQQHVLWVPSVGYSAPSTGNAFGRFCAGDLPEESAFYDAASGTGFDGRLYMNGEEFGAEGRAFAHGLDGISYELPRLGKFSWENSVASPEPGLTTVVAGLDDSGGGQVYFYFGTKTNAGSPVDRAGLTDGKLYGLRISGVATEPTLGLAAPTAFDLYEHGNVENTTGAALQTASVANGVTGFQRPEDGVWDPNNPNHFYFVTTASFTGSTRLWVLRFNDAQDPTAGGEIEMLIDGATEGGKMFDNMTMDRYGHIYLQEDVGGNAHIGKIHRYDVATDALTEVAEHYRPYYEPGVDPLRFKTIDEEASGIIDVSDILGPGHFLLNDQSHNSIAGELVQDGQLLHMYDPAAAGL
ncbi:MAG: hypothetical protein RJA70_1922 [Pseudomonadota bacterium]